MADRARNAETCWLAVIKDDPLHPSPPDITQAASHQLLGLYATENRRDDAAEVIWETYERTSPADHLALLGMRVKNELERLAPEATIGRLERYVAADRTDWKALRCWPVPNWLWAARKTPIAISRPVSRDVPMTLEFGVTTSACFTTWGTRTLGRRPGQGSTLCGKRIRDLEIPRTPERENRRLGRRGPGLSNGPESQSLRDGFPLPAGHGRGASRAP